MDDAPTPEAGERLQKFLSAAGVASRRKSEDLIRQGRVRVNGEAVTLGRRVQPDDDVRVDGVPVGAQAPVYLILNKPTGVVTTLDDPQGRATVDELIDVEQRVYPVGRLDQETSGLLVMTNDGELAHRLMHPSYEVNKTYEAMVAGAPDNTALVALRQGISLDGRLTAPAQVELLAAGADESHIRMVIHEGRNRQVRRMCDAVGHSVTHLTRTKYGPLTLGTLRPGAWRSLEAAEVRRLYKLVGMSRPRHAPRASGDDGDGNEPDGQGSHADGQSGAGSEDR